jgi:hypothetical protein
MLAGEDLALSTHTWKKRKQNPLRRCFMKAGKVGSFPEAESEDLSIAKALVAAPEWSKNVPEMFPVLRNLLAGTTAESGE